MSEPDPARARFAIIQLVRLAGVALFLIGLLVVNNRIGWPHLAGYVMLLIGLFDITVAPVLLARRWRSGK